MRTFDAIVIGAGHNGLCLAAYLARAGLKTVIVERRHEEGGGASTEEAVRPGFRHNLHAQHMAFFNIMPPVHDFRLRELGLRTTMPEAQMGITFADGRPPIVLHRPDLLDRTHASIARYSKTDADTFCELKKRAMKLEQFLAISLYYPPLNTPAFLSGDLVDAIFGDMGLSSFHALKSAKVLIDELFETPELRALLYRASVEWGVPIDQSAVFFLTFTMWMVANWELCHGGTHSFAHALIQACYREGVELLECSRVERVIIKDGRAVGVQLSGGEEIQANRLVASNVDLQTTLLELVGEHELSSSWVARTRNFRYGPGHVAGTLCFCLNEPPQYRSARWDPDIDRCYNTIVGFEGSEDMIRHIRQAYAGVVPNPAASTWVNTLWDSSQAPPRRHTATGWFFFPPASGLSPEEWAEIRATYNDRFLDVWERFAPNMTNKNVIAHRLFTPDLIEQRSFFREGDTLKGAYEIDQLGPNRPFPEASQYRTEIEGLYLCGSSSHPGGGIHAGCGYNAYKSIAEDLGLPSPVAAGRSW